MVIGLSLVALGTSLPELFTAVIASLKKAEKINVGMVLGSNIFNTLLILGVAALILPIPVAKHDVYISIPIMILFTAVWTFSAAGIFFIYNLFIRWVKTS